MWKAGRGKKSRARVYGGSGMKEWRETLQWQEGFLFRPSRADADSGRPLLSPPSTCIESTTIVVTIVVVSVDVITTTGQPRLRRGKGGMTDAAGPWMGWDDRRALPWILVFLEAALATDFLTTWNFT